MHPFVSLQKTPSLSEWLHIKVLNLLNIPPLSPSHAFTMSAAPVLFYLLFLCWWAFVLLGMSLFDIVLLLLHDLDHYTLWGRASNVFIYVAEWRKNNSGRTFRKNKRVNWGPQLFLVPSGKLSPAQGTNFTTLFFQNLWKECHETVT